MASVASYTFVHVKFVGREAKFFFFLCFVTRKGEKYYDARVCLCACLLAAMFVGEDLLANRRLQTLAVLIGRKKSN